MVPVKLPDAVCVLHPCGLRWLSSRRGSMPKQSYAGQLLARP